MARVAAHLVSAFALVVGTALAARAQGAPGGPGGAPPDVQRAQAAFTAGRADSTVAILEAFFTANPNAPQGRLLLGNAHRQLGNFERALAAYDQVRPRPAATKVAADVAAAAMLTKLNRPSEAVARLASVKRSGSFDMDLIRSDSVLGALASAPGFDTVMFRPADFERPFVEPVRIIHEWRGENKNDQYSWIARGIGDVDGDGRTDIVTSAPSFGATATTFGRGKVYVYSGRTGALLWSHVGDSAAALGNGLEAAGDVNRDGIPDVVAGAPGISRAYVFSGRDGRVLLTLSGTEIGGGFGRSASGAGDQDGDGYADVIIGAPTGAGIAPLPGTPPTSPPIPGRAYVFSGRDGSLLRTLNGTTPGDGFGSIVAGQRDGNGSLLLIGAPGAGTPARGRVFAFAPGSDTPRYEIAPDSTGAALGAMFSSVIGDIDRDGVRDLFASDFADASRGPGSGRVYINSGATGQRLLSLAGEMPGDGFGIGSPDVGDVNGDGVPDLVLGAWQHASAAPSGGKIYLFSGKDGSVLRTITGRVPGETLGFDAAGVGDVDGDGVTDLLLTSSWSNVNGFRSGRMYVISGR
jgi:hypothetical protein